MAQVNVEYVLKSFEKRGLKQKHVAEQMHISPSLLSQKLNGHCGWSIDDLVFLSRFLGVSMERLVKE